LEPSRTDFSSGRAKPKTKLIVAVAIDVKLVSVEGATALGRRALKAGATKEEIVEAMKVAYNIGGNSSLFTLAAVLKALLRKK
jgi:alkylhydroperoxidase/carboxymuconolactone decarboxylase family protein YurZ